MSRRVVLSLMIVVCLSLGGAVAQEVIGVGSQPMADKNADQGRNISGQVLTKSDAPVPEAIVYLKNTKTLAIKSFITEKDGGYRFPRLSPNVDYEIYAEFQGQKSGTKTVSSFDNRTNVTLNIHIDTK